MIEKDATKIKRTLSEETMVNERKCTASYQALHLPTKKTGITLKEGIEKYLETRRGDIVFCSRSGRYGVVEVRFVTEYDGIQTLNRTLKIERMGIDIHLQREKENKNKDRKIFLILCMSSTYSVGSLSPNHQVPGITKQNIHLLNK